MSRIGIGITERNRPEVFAKCLENVKKYMPSGAKLLVVDDNSDLPVKEATVRHDRTWGIARSKNHCLELLDDCDFIFLFDSDCWPKADNWWIPYINSREPHMSYIFTQFAVKTTKPLKDCQEIYRDKNIAAYTHARGCMMYIRKEVLGVVGGLDTSYGGSMYEHGDWSNRIHNAGLTTFKVMDVPESNKLFHSMDEYAEVESSISKADRQANILLNKPKYLKRVNSNKYCEYRIKTNNVILAAYLNDLNDPQTGKKWSNKEKLEPLIKSVKDQKLVILEGSVEPFNPYFQRWLEYFKYLRDHPEIDNVFIVDATDTEMLRNPFEVPLGDNIYVGQEENSLGIPWMLRHNTYPTIRSFVVQNRTKTLLNCGVVGGSRQNLMNLCQDIFNMYFESNKAIGPYEMGVFNMLMYTKYVDKLVHGPEVTTKFKAYETDNKVARFRHK